MLMSKFRKKPIVIEAVQFDPRSLMWPEGVIPWGDVQPRDMSWGYIKTLEGKMHVMAGDWIITGIKGERYPCKPDIFDATYEPADAPMDELAAAERRVLECEATIEQLRGALAYARLKINHWHGPTMLYPGPEYVKCIDVIDAALQGKRLSP